MTVEMVGNLEETLDVYDCNSHRATSLDEAYDKLQVCDDDFMFFPMDSINSNLTNVANLFAEIKLDFSTSLPFALSVDDDTYCNKEDILSKKMLTTHLNKDTEKLLTRYFNKDVALFIVDSILDAYLYINKFSVSKGKSVHEYCYMELIPEKMESEDNKWHFDGTGEGHNLLTLFTSPGTEFCSTTYDNQARSMLDEYAVNELSDKCNQFHYQLQTGESVIYNAQKGFHKAPDFNDGRSFIKFMVY
jgi:hypothetical protein